MDIDIERYDRWFLRRLAVDLGRAEQVGASEAALHAYLVAHDEDWFIAALVAGQFTLDLPGHFRLTPEAFWHYPDVAQQPRAREQARIVVQSWLGQWRDIIALWPELGLLLVIAYAPGDRYWEPMRVKAREDLASRIPFGLHSGAVRKAVAHRALREGSQRAVETHKAKVIALTLVWPVGVVGPRRVRFGPSWLKDGRTGRSVAVEPQELRWRYLWKWLQQETARLATAYLLDQPMRPVPPPAGSGGDATGLLDALQLGAYLDEWGASPRERDVAFYCALHPGATSPQIAAALDIDASTVRVLRHRLNRRRTTLLDSL